MSRDHLITLLEEAEGLVNNDRPALEQIADHLIANGVTLGDPLAPLTVEQLRQMDGEPVWIKFLYPAETCLAHWRIHDNNIMDCEWKSYGSYWVAYARKPMGEWIPVEERLPSQDERWIYVEENLFEPSEFIVLIEGAEIPTVLCFSGESFCDQEGNHYRVSHWQPLPDAPKEME